MVRSGNRVLFMGVSRGIKPIMPLTPYQDGSQTRNGAAHIFVSEADQYYVSENIFIILSIFQYVLPF